MPYEKNVSCGKKLFEVTCPGNLTGAISYACPYLAEQPSCLLWSDVEKDYVVAPGCTAVEFDSEETVCFCSGDAFETVSPGRRLASSSAQYYEFASRTYNESIDFIVGGIIIDTFFHEDIGKNIIVFLTLIISTVVFLFGVYILTRSNYAQFQFQDSIFAREFYLVLKFANSLLSYDQDDSLVKHFITESVLKNEYFSVFRWKAQLRKSESVELLEQWLILCGYFLNFMLVHAILAWCLYADVDLCNYSDMQSCKAKISPVLLVSKRCEWDSTENHCHLQSPLRNIIEVFILVAFTSVFVVPINFWWKIACHSLCANSHRLSTYPLLSGSESQDRLQPLKIEKPDSSFSKPSESPRESNSGKASKNKVGVLPLDNQDITGVHQVASGHASPVSTSSMKIYYKSFRSSKVDDTGSSGLQGSVLDEVNYVLSEAEKILSVNDFDKSAASSAVFQRNYLKEKLNLDSHGRIYSQDPTWATFGCGSCVTRPITKLEGKLRKTRRVASSVSRVASLFSDDELKSIYLIEQFLVSCLPESLRHFANRYFFSIDEFLNGLSWGNKFYYYCPYFMIPYVVGALVFLLVFAFQFFEHGVNAAWLSLVAINCALDCVLNIPFRNYVKDIFIPGMFMQDLRIIHSHLKTQYHHVVHRMQKGVAAPELELVQHFNAACRATRISGIDSPIINSFLWISDMDVSALSGNDNASRGIFGTLKFIFFWLLHGLILLFYHISPSEIFVDLVLEFFVLLVVLLIIVAVYALGEQFVWLPFVVVFGVIFIFWFIDFMSKSASTGVDNRSKKQSQVLANFNELLPKMILMKALNQQENGGNKGQNDINHMELLVVRKELLSVEYDVALRQSKEDSVSASYLKSQITEEPAMEKEPVVLAKSVSSEPDFEPVKSEQEHISILIPTTSAPFKSSFVMETRDTYEEVEGAVTKERAPSPRSGQSFSFSTKVEVVEQEQAVAIPIDDSNDSVLEVITPKVGENTTDNEFKLQKKGSSSTKLLPIHTSQLSDSFQKFDSFMDSPSPKKEKIQISSKDYKILTAAVATYIRNAETEQYLKGKEYNGSKMSEVVDWVVLQSIAGGEKSDENISKHKKIVQKILKRMMQKDGTVILVPSDSNTTTDSLEKSTGKLENGDKMIMLHTAEKIRNHFFSHHSGDQEASEGAGKAHFPIVKIVHETEEAPPASTVNLLELLKSTHEAEINNLEKKLSADRLAQEQALLARLADRKHHDNATDIIASNNKSNEFQL